MIKFKEKVIENLRTSRKPGLKGFIEHQKDKLRLSYLPDYAAISLGELAREHLESGKHSEIYLRSGVQYWPKDKTSNFSEPFDITLSDGITDLEVLVEPSAFYRNTTNGEPPLLTTPPTLLEVFSNMKPGSELNNIVFKKFNDNNNLWIWSFDTELYIPVKNKSKKTCIDYLEVLGMQPVRVLGGN